MLELFDKHEPVDIVTVAEALERQAARGGRRTVRTCRASRRPDHLHAVQYARIVERKAVLRNLVARPARIAGIGYEAVRTI